MTAADLMARYCDGDAAAFRDLYAQVAPRLLGYLVGMARSRALAEDLVQQTFLKVHRARGAYIRGADPVPWIYAIAHRTFLDELRRVKRAAAPLPAAQREAVVLTKLDGKSIAEAAEIAGTTPGAMKVRAHRGYLALRKLLGAS
jgi:DNA-directed RNA polymerase specialized sigma24 family protein